LERLIYTEYKRVSTAFQLFF